MYDCIYYLSSLRVHYAPKPGTQSAKTKHLFIQFEGVKSNSYEETD